MDREMLYHLYWKEGKTLAQIAKELGIKFPTEVAKLLRQFDIPVRKPGQRASMLTKKQSDRQYFLNHKEKVYEKNRKWSQSHHEYYLNYRRKHCLTTQIDGKRVYYGRLNKRDYPEVCELCQAFQGLLHYHHWNGNPNIGLWLCPRCHIFARKVEQGLTDQYLALKHKIEQNAEIQEAIGG